MLKYLVILLDDSSVSYCHYTERDCKKLIPLEMLKRAVRFAMIENLNIQFVWPNYELPEEYKIIISSIDHINIVPISLTNDTDILVVEPSQFDECPNGATIVAKVYLKEILESPDILLALFPKVDRLNILISNPMDFRDSDIALYLESLRILADASFKEMKSGHNLQINLITDRLMLNEMNNCNAGYESITLAPDGNFYLCPAFYYGGSKPLGSIEEGLDIKNPQLYQLNHAPICRECDAWHCRRCIWLNKKATLEVNTPGHEQCVMAHIERNVAMELNERIKQISGKYPRGEIVEIDYLDPFDKIQKKI